MNNRSIIVPLKSGGHLRIDDTKKVLKISPNPKAEKWARDNLEGAPIFRENGDSPAYPSWEFPKPENY